MPSSLFPAPALSVSGSVGIISGFNHIDELAPHENGTNVGRNIGMKKI